MSQEHIEFVLSARNMLHLLTGAEQARKAAEDRLVKVLEYQSGLENALQDALAELEKHKRSPITAEEAVFHVVDTGDVKAAPSDPPPPPVPPAAAAQAAPVEPGLCMAPGCPDVATTYGYGQRGARFCALHGEVELSIRREWHQTWKHERPIKRAA